VFIQLGGNFLSATPDTLFVQKAMANLRLSVRIGTKLNRTDLVTGQQSLILPCLGRSEIDRSPAGDAPEENDSRFITTENSMGVVELSRGRFEPAGPLLLSETSIVCRLAAATLGARSTVDWLAWERNYDLVRDAIARTIPGCQNYNARVRKPGGFYLPNGARDNQYNTDIGRAKFTVNAIPPRDVQPGELVMMTIRSHDQFNTTVYNLNDRYRGVYNERRVIFMNRQDMKDRGLVGRDVVDIASHFNGETRHARRFIVIPYEIPAGNCATYFPEANVLVPIGSTSKKSNQPTSKYVRVTVRRADG
jgi:anaerobic selenocysteine-containing dehydrogenase